MSHKKNKPNQIILGRFTKKAWKELVSEDEYLWSITQRPNNMCQFLEHNLGFQPEKISDEDPRNITVKIVTLDNDYIKWLKDNNFEENEETRIDYCSTVSDEQASKAIKRCGMHRSRYLMAFPIIVSYMPDTLGELETYYQLPNSVSSEIADALSDAYRNYKVIVPGVIEKANTVIYHDDDEWFDVMIDKVDKKAEEWDSEQQHETIYLPFTVLYVPFLLEVKHAGATFSLDEYIHSFEYHMDEYLGPDSDGDAFETCMGRVSKALEKADCFKRVDVGMLSVPVPHEIAQMQERSLLHSLYESLGQKPAVKTKSVSPNKQKWMA